MQTREMLQVIEDPSGPAWRLCRHAAEDNYRSETTAEVFGESKPATVP